VSLAGPHHHVAHRPATDVDALAALGPATVAFVAPGSLTSGASVCSAGTWPPNAGGLDPHCHTTFSESFSVLDGTVRLADGTTWRDATAGDYLYVPEGGVHAFRNDSDAPASMLILFAPGSPRERYIQELADIAASGRTLSAEERTALYARYDQYMV
jgi:mannose-6-phosphate isomerase-like protein (cupin superfamily)